MAAEQVKPTSSLLLRNVNLTNFKSFSGSVSVGPFDEHMTCIVGPNGSGKSCLVEGVCFALAVGSQQLRAPALSSLVNHHNSQAGHAAVAVHFAEDEGGSGAQLVVQRRIVSGRRSEWNLQECSCVGTSAATPPWVCGHCAVASVKRDELRAVLQRLLSIDINAPERFVVHQSSVMCIASKSPAELLDFLEGVVGTAGMRQGVLEEAARSLELATSAQVAEDRLGAARSEMERHVKSIRAFQVLEQSRRALESLKRTHLRREVAFHSHGLIASEARLKEQRGALTSLEGQLECARAAAAAADGRLKASTAAKTKCRLAVTTAERHVGRMRDEVRALLHTCRFYTLLHCGTLPCEDAIHIPVSPRALHRPRGCS